MVICESTRFSCHHRACPGDPHDRVKRRGSVPAQGWPITSGHDKEKAIPSRCFPVQPRRRAGPADQG
jgi:hypothetical protein